MIKSIIVLLISVMFAACGGGERTSDPNRVVVWNLSDPAGLNPITARDAAASYINQFLYQRLLDFDHETLELIPVLAKSMPEIEVTDEGGMRITYEVRPEARWSNGEPITARDVEFTFKAMMSPRVDNMHRKGYIDFITEIELDPENDRRIILLSDETYNLVEYSTGNIPWIIPAYIFDPDGLLEGFTFSELKDDPALSNHPDIVAFAREVNSEKYAREARYLNGSGAYEFVSWRTGQRIILERKEDWWGDDVEDAAGLYFTAIPRTLVLQTINDQTAAITALKGGRLDIMRSIRSQEFAEDLSQNERFLENYELHTPPQFSYAYIGLNTRNPKLRNKKTRQAIAHLFDYDRIMRDVIFGYGERLVGPLNPLKDGYNHDLPLHQYDLAKARSLLREAGWVEDRDGILVKDIDGQRTRFDLTFIYNTGNRERERVGLIFQQAARQAGINVSIQSYEWGIFLDRARSQNFEMFLLGWVSSPGPEDLTLKWHTSAIGGGGSNYVQFGNAQSDALLEKMYSTMDRDEQIELMKELQAIIHDEVPTIFLWTPRNLLAAHKRLNVIPSAYYPGFYAPSFDPH